MGRDERTERFFLESLDRDCSVIGLHCHSLDGVQQHRLTYPSKTREHQALLGPSLLDAAQQNARLFENGVPPHQLRRGRPSARRKGVLDRVHGRIILYYFYLLSKLSIND